MPKRRLLGCSFPLLIGILAVLLSLLIISFISGGIGKSLFGNLALPGWLSVPQPAPELPAEVVFHIFGFPITNSIIAAWLTIIVLVGFSWVVTRRARLVPKRWQALLEFALGSFLGICQNIAGEKNGRRFFPIVMTIFLFVVFNAWLSLLPGFGSITVLTHEGEVPLLRGANTDINVPLALALISFVFVEYVGLKARGLHYLEKFINFGNFFRSIRLLVTGKLKAGLSGLMLGVVDIFVGFLETVSELIRIVSFTFRLFGNMTAGEILVLIATFLIPWFVQMVYGFELIIGFVQALIFAGLTLVFASMAVVTHEEHTSNND